MAVVKYNCRFLKDWNNPMKRMNCMRRCRIPENNIVSYRCGMCLVCSIWQQGSKFKTLCNNYLIHHYKTVCTQFSRRLTAIRPMWNHYRQFVWSIATRAPSLGRLFRISSLWLPWYRSRHACVGHVRNWRSSLSDQLGKNRCLEQEKRWENRAHTEFYNDGWCNYYIMF